jgi:hypothetical protein
MKKAHVATFTLVLALFVGGLTALDLQAARTPGVMLARIDPAIVDDVLQSYVVTAAARIKFVNQSSSPVDIYWINFEGHRVLFEKNLAVNASWTAGTFLTHPWLIVVSGTGGTAESDTGLRLGGFVALTTNGDTAIITN